MRTRILLPMLLLCVTQLNADEPLPMDGNRPSNAAPTTPPNADRGKARLEAPVKGLLATNPNSLPQLASPDDPPGVNAVAAPELKFVPKMEIESSTIRLVERTAPADQQVEVDFTPLWRANGPELPVRDIGKGFIERPLEGLVAAPLAEVNSAEPTAAEELDVRKKKIERPVEAVVTDIPTIGTEASVENVLRRDGDTTKRLVIEKPVTEIVADDTSTENTRQPNELFSEEIASDEKPLDDNPKVEPGMVRWHESFDEAKEAATSSGKPVLLFHLMGQLDQRFT